MRHAVIVVALTILAVLGSQGPNGKETDVRVLGGLGHTTQRALCEGGISFHREGSTLVINASDKDQLVKVLSTVLHGIHKRIEVAELNLRNANTTRCADGLPYRKQEVTLNPDGSPAGIMESQLDFYWVYAPGHPDAVKQGTRAGYVAQPNVDPEAEARHIEHLQRRAAVLLTIISKLDPELIVPGSVDFESLEYDGRPGQMELMLNEVARNMKDQADPASHTLAEKPD